MCNYKELLYINNYSDATEKQFSPLTMPGANDRLFSLVTGLLCN